MHRLGIDEYVEYFKRIVGRSENLIMSDNEIFASFREKRILVIGAGGTIGSSLVERLSNSGLTNIYITDRDESALHGVILNATQKISKIAMNSHVADIRDLQSLREVFNSVRPEIVFHAAALKHLPVLEKAPREAFFANIIGTYNVVKLCLEFDTLQIVNISTDKAAFPTSILGKTKKLAEILVEEASRDSSLSQCSVRFGNVFASRGSVIETFEYQISNSKDVTITHPEVTRYFMSRNEAAELVLVAASLKESGTYIQEMGEQISIVEIVQNLASELGKTPQIKFTGLTPGEKLHEELFDGPAIRTRYPQILQSRHTNREGLVKDIDLATPRDNETARILIEQLSDTYIS